MKISELREVNGGLSMIDAAQIRAARAFLGWGQADLARAARMTINGISKIERGDVTAHRAHRGSLEKIQKAFEDAGVEFLPGSGVRKKDRIVETYEGEGALQQLIEDVYNTLRGTGGELCIAHVDEGNAIESLTKDYLMEQIRKRKEAKITHRLLVKANDPSLIPPYDTYRSVPDEYFSPHPFYIYGSKLGLVSWEPAPRVVVINDERFAESARKLFNFMWDNAKEVLEVNEAATEPKESR
jgi:transcriptional regulator with XRE-family HTH domain